MVSPLLNRCDPLHAGVCPMVDIMRPLSGNSLILTRRSWSTGVYGYLMPSHAELVPLPFASENDPVSSSLNIQLTDALREYVDERASNKDVYAMPSEYIRDLIRRDMQDRAVALNVLEGLDDLKQGRFSNKSILELKDEVRTRTRTRTVKSSRKK